LLRERLRRLEELRAANDATFDELIKQMETDFKKSGIERSTEVVDTTALILDVGNTLRKMVEKGFKSINLAGRELDALNKDLVEDLLTFVGLGPATQEVAGQASGDTLRSAGNGGLKDQVAAMVKLSGDLTAPSFWFTFAKVWLDDSSITLEESFARAMQGPAAVLLIGKERLELQRAKTNKALDARILQTKELLNAFTKS
jgi:hypothetical protein